MTMMFPPACADFSFPLLPHEDVLRLIRMLRIEGVDIGLFEGRSHLWPSRELEQPAAAGAALRRKVEDEELHLTDVFLTPGEGFQELAANHFDPHERACSRDIFTRCVEYTHAAGGQHISALPGVHWEEESYQDSFSRCVEELAWRVEQAQQADITFSVEAHIGSIVPTPEQAKTLIESTPRLTLTLDYGHFVKEGMAQERIEPLIAHAAHFHVRGGSPGRLQTSFKNNTIDFERVLRVMDETGYSGALGIEYVWIDWEGCNEVDNLSETILFRDFLQRVMRDE